MSSILLKSEIKLEELCRTCLSKEIELHSVFDVCLGTITLNSVITTITGLKIEAGDGLPTTVCRECKEKATSAFDFKSRSLEADETLRGLLTVKSEDTATSSVVFEPLIAEVKSEEYQADTADDYLDLDFNLPVSNGDETLTSLGENKPLNTNLDYNIQRNSNGSDGLNDPADCDEGSSTYCPVCGVSYENAAGLTRHMWQCHADIMGPKKRGRPKQLLTSTILSKLSENGYQAATRLHPCALCRAEMASREDLALHMTQHKDEKVWSCQQCKKMFLTEIDVDRHSCVNSTGALQQQENEPPHKQLDPKPKTSATEVLLHELLMQRNDAECDGVVHVCSSCGGVFLSAGELAGHRDADHPDQSLRCGHCHKVFASLRGAARHRDSCALVERSFACVSCGARFQHEITLNKHILRHHAGHPVSVRFPAAAQPNAAPSAADTHRCDTCRRTFCRKELLLNHMKLHKTGDKNFECDICNKKFHRRNNLRSHLRTHEIRPSPGVSSACLCLYCGRGFSNSSNLIVHMRRHTGEKPYKCDFCGKGFPRSSDLQCHRRSHTGEKPCVCGVCGKGFSRSNKLSRHMRVHTGLKPYKCPYCEKAFSQSNDLTLHVRRHTGDKPYVCELCGDRFIQGTALHNHRRAHGHYPTTHDAGLHAQHARTHAHSADADAHPSALAYPTPTLAN